MSATAAGSRNKVILVSALTAAAVGAAGLAAMALPIGAGGQPSLPEITAEELVTSALSAKPPALGGTVHVTNLLGLPPLPGLPQQALSGDTDVRVWYDGERRGRISLPSTGGEQAWVYDGTTLWRWDSASRTVTKSTKPEAPTAHPEERAFDPAAVAARVLAMVRPTSTVAVEGTATVADRPAYELVVAPAPTERTLVRELRVAVDAQTRIPLRLQLLAHGSNDPVFAAGFADLTVGPQDAALFQFTPPEGATVVEKAPRPDKPDTRPDARPDAGLLGAIQPKIVGDGWDTVLVARLPANAPSDKRGGDPRALLDRIGTPISGAWGSGRLITTAVATAIITDDGRVALGAVPQQVLIEALAQ
jgi:outer membrane lipoprotein-sorting protein